MLAATERGTRATVLALAFSVFAAGMFPTTGWSTSPSFKEQGIYGSVLLEAEPAIGDWSYNTGTQLWVSDGGYSLAFQRSASEPHGVWTLELSRTDGKTFRVKQLKWQLTTELGGVATVFDTQAHSPTSILRRAPAIDAAIDVRPNQGVPYQAASDHYGNNRLAVGAMDVTGTYRMTARKRADEFTISLARNEYAGDAWFTGERFRDAVFVSAAPTFWFDTARAYADQVDGQRNYVPLKTPECADLPYYSTWYGFGENIDEQIIRTQAKMAKEMGCGVFQIFIGWSVCDNWFDSGNSWGDYTPCKTRFEDFGKLVDYLQDDLGLAVQVWTAPTWIGAKSEAFKKMSEFRCKWPEGDYSRSLDPRSPEAREYIRKQFAKLASSWGVDGYYVDFADTLFNRNDAPHPMDPAHFGTAYNEFLDAMHDGFTRQQQHALCEFRQPFANLTSKPYATLFNTTYTDGDWEKSHRIAVVQPPFSAGVITRCDPLTFNKEQFSNRDEMGKALSATILSGVPGLSMDLTSLSQEERDRLAAWLEFYTEHREQLTQGEMTLFGNEYHLPEVMVHHGTTAFARVSRWETGHIPFPEGTRHAFIFVALPEEVSFIARLDPRRWSGLQSGKYRCRWVDSSLESHEGWFEMSLAETEMSNEDAQLKSPREVWGFDPHSEGVPSLGVKRGGFLELVWVGDPM